MIKIVAADALNDHEIRLRFSDDSSGIVDLSPFLSAGTPMTEPLRDPDFFGPPSSKWAPWPGRTVSN